jgi:hypothetical protein
MENITEKLYYRIGQLLYAIAMADKKIDKKEIIALKTKVSENWKQQSVSLDDSSINAPLEILKAFSQMQKNVADSDSCYSEFREYYLENQNLFSLELNKLIWDTAQYIAISTAKKNKSELVILAKLRMLFQA